MSSVIRLGVVSFLNSRPLIDGLADDPRFELLLDVPSALPGKLDAGQVDAALIPVVDLLRNPGRYRVVSDACIGCDGETMTVRVFARVPPNRVRTLWVDSDSHTSVALATVLWRELFDAALSPRRLNTRGQTLDDCEAVLLIGDKVVDPGRGSFGYEVDLGGAWREHAGLPFVFAVWAAREAQATDELSAALSAARDRGVARAERIAETEGPRHGWPVELARRYLTRCLRFTLDARAVQGTELFARLCREADIVPAGAAIHWPPALRPCPRGATP